MVGEGENSHAEKESRTDGPCTRGRPYGSYKKQKTIEIVELSSTITHTFTIIDYSALSKSQKKEDKSFESSSEDVNSSKQQDVVEKVDRLGTSVQDLQKVVTTLTQIIVTNPPMITHIGTHGGVPYVFNPFQTPLNTSPANQIQTEMIMSKLTPSGQTLFRSVNFKEGINKAQEQGIMTDPPIRKLFTPLEGVNNAGFYFNYQSLQSIKHDGRKLGVQIPNWAPMLFSPPKDMLLDDIDAAVAAYIFGVNKEDKKMETKYGKGDRNLLKTLMPKGLVDQEQYVCTWTTPPDILRKRYQERFMGKVEYVSKVVTESSRMQLALDLVLKNYNTKNKEVKKLAFGNLDKLEKQHNRLVKK
ncbi:hypothetical protein SESBI_43970 [Sesbania bispinosa]|nr:hypothetical protein SESBI_43970 [Sesbania bispinosa]